MIVWLPVEVESKGDLLPRKAAELSSGWCGWDVSGQRFGWHGKCFSTSRYGGAARTRPQPTRLRLKTGTLMHSPAQPAAVSSLFQTSLLSWQASYKAGRTTDQAAA